MWGPVRFTMPFIVLPGGGDVVIIGQKILREKLRIDVMIQLKASVLKAHGREDGPDMEATAGAADEPKAGAVLRAAMAIALRKNALRAYEGMSSELIPPSPRWRVGTCD